MVHGGGQKARHAKRGWRVPLRWLLLLLLPLSASVSFAQWDFTHAGDPNRNWGVSATESAVYDDNFNATPKKQESGVQLDSDLRFRASVPLERFFAGMQYDYGVVYPRDVKFGGVNETHNLSLSANYTVSPRLTLSMNEAFINSLQPELVRGPNSAPVTVVQAGTYIYDSVGGGFNYLLSEKMVPLGLWLLGHLGLSSIESCQQ